MGYIDACPEPLDTWKVKSENNLGEWFPHSQEVNPRLKKVARQGLSGIRGTKVAWTAW